MSVRLSFLILAHDLPEQTAELARTLVAVATDATAYIHFDVRAPAASFAALRAAVAGEPRIRLVEKRVAGAWGSFGLVEGPLNALAQMEAEGTEPDYVMLLSGACLPNRPIHELEAFLAANFGREFIEIEDASWIGNGWRDERWLYRFWFNHKTQHGAEWGFYQAQRLLGLRRQFPEGLTPRFGSQWWTLSWPLCEAILADTRRSPWRLNFFRSVWIPDEMVFQTYVHALVPPEAITGFGLTHFQFSNRGKPVVFHDDHTDYVLGLDRFFFRKASPAATRLRANCLARAAETRNAAMTSPNLATVGRRRTDYLARTLAQTRNPFPGQPFYRDQYSDMTESVLAAASEPYVAVIGPPAMTRAVLARISGPHFTVLGEIFAPGEVDLGTGRSELGGLRRTDAAIRDLHPAQFMTRIRERCDRVPVIALSALGQGRLLKALLADSRALKIACLPVGDDLYQDALTLALACLADPRHPPLPKVPMPGIPTEKALRAQVHAYATSSGGWFEELAAAVISVPRDLEARGFARTALCLPWQPRPDPRAARQGLKLAEEMAASCGFRRFSWFSEIATVVRAMSADFAGAGLPPMLAPAAEAFPEVFHVAPRIPARTPTRTVAAARDPDPDGQPEDHRAAAALLRGGA